MGKPIDKKDTDQRTVTEYLRDTNPTAYAAMMQRETVQPSTTLTNVGFVAPDDWLGIKADIAEDREYMRQYLGQWVPVTHDESVFAKAVEKIAKAGTQAPSYLGSPTTLQNFDAYIKTRLREMYPETDGVPPPPLVPNPFLSMIKKEPAPAVGRRYVEPIDKPALVEKDDALFFGGVKITADSTLKPNEMRMVLGVDCALEPATAATVVMKVEQRADGPYCTVVDEWCEAIDHENRKLDSVRIDDVCGNPFCFCARKH